jgi:hypothetical protein
MPVYYGYEVQIDAEPERWGPDDKYATGFTLFDDLSAGSCGQGRGRLGTPWKSLSTVTGPL